MTHNNNFEILKGMVKIIAGLNIRKEKNVELLSDIHNTIDLTQLSPSERRSLKALVAKVEPKLKERIRVEEATIASCKKAIAEAEAIVQNIEAHLAYVLKGEEPFYEIKYKSGDKKQFSLFDAKAGVKILYVPKNEKARQYIIGPIGSDMWKKTCQFLHYGGSNIYFKIKDLGGDSIQFVYNKVWRMRKTYLENKHFISQEQLFIQAAVNNIELASKLLERIAYIRGAV